MKRNVLLLFAWMTFVISFAQTPTEGHVTFTKGQRATIILPTTPDSEKGRYYRLDRWENEQIIFEEETHPKARIPYIIVPDEDFSIDLSTLDLSGLFQDTAKIDDVHFVGSYVEKYFGEKDGFRYYFVDTTPDCYNVPGHYSHVIGALRAFFEIWHNFSYKWTPLDIVFHDHATPIATPSVQPSDIKRNYYDLQGRKLSGKPAQGIYIEGGKKKVK